MSIQWDFNENDYQEQSFAPIPVGDHRVRISSIEEKKSQNGNDMLEIILDVSEYSGRIWYYLTFQPKNPQMTNRQLGQIYDSFGITPGNMNFSSWVGKVGGARVKHEQWKGDTREQVSYFLTRSKVDNLPAWQDTPGKASVTGGVPTVDTDELPFI